VTGKVLQKVSLTYSYYEMMYKVVILKIQYLLLKDFLDLHIQRNKNRFHEATSQNTNCMF
jgi:hypothetical protein